MSGPPDVTLAQMRYFERAATHRSMTRAAAELRIAQSAVSAAVAQLERRVGTQVFIRQRARGLVLTSEGEELLRDVRSALAHVEEVLDGAQGRGQDVRGRVRLACFVTLAPFVLPELVADVAQHHPGIVLDVVEAEAEAISSALRTGSVEVALSYDLGLGEEIERHPVMRVPPYVILPPGHRLASRTHVHLADLGEDSLVLLDLPHSRDYFERVLASVGITGRARYRSGSYETVRGLVARGLGYSILNLRPVQDVTYGGGTVVARPIADDVPDLSIVVARLRSLRPTVRSRAVTARAQAVLLDHPRGV